MTVTIRIADTLEPRGFFASRYNGTPTTAASEKKDQLPLCQVQCYFCLDLCKVFGYWYIRHR